MKPALVVLGLFIHGIMLLSLFDHFGRQAGPALLAPVVRPAAPVRGRLPPPAGPALGERSWHGRQHRARKMAEARSRPLEALPPRHSASRALDRLVRDATRTDPGGDFFQLYASGVALQLGASVFEETFAGGDPELTRRVRQSAPFHPPNRYPPVVAQTLGRLLSRWRPFDAYWLWIAVHELVLAATLAMGAGLVARPDRALVWAAGLGFLPWYLELYMGQTTFLVGWSIVAVVLLASLGRDWAATAAWAVGLAVKPLGLLLAPGLSGHLRARHLAAGILLPALASLPYFWGRPQELALFAGWAFGQQLVTGVGNCGVQNLVYHLTYSKYSVPAVTAAGLALSLAATARGRAGLAERCALWLLTYFVVYAHVWEHHYILVVPVVVLLWAAGRRRLGALLWAGAALPSLFWLLGDGLGWARETAYLAWKTAPVLGAYGTLVTAGAARRGRP